MSWIINVETLLIDALKAGGYDGLYLPDTSDYGLTCCGGCDLDDLIACGDDPSFCRPGYFQGDPDAEDTVIGPERSST